MILGQRTKRVHSMTGSKGQLRPQMRLQQLSLAYTSVSILLRKTSPSNIINYYSMPDGNSRAYIYIIARLLKISKLPRILAVILVILWLFVSIFLPILHTFCVAKLRKKEIQAKDFQRKISQLYLLRTI